LGAMMVTKLQLAAMSRTDIKMEERKDFYLYVDEFQNFSTESFANILSEARKYKLDLILAHQYLEQLDEKVRSAIFGNVGTIICFRVGAEDAEMFEKEFAPEFSANDLVNLTKYHIYIKLMIEGMSSKAFSAKTLSPFQPQVQSLKDIIIENSRSRFGTPREKVEEKIASELQATAQTVEERIGRRDEQSLGRVLQKEEPREERKPSFFRPKKEVNIEELKGVLESSLDKLNKPEENQPPQNQ